VTVHIEGSQPFEEASLGEVQAELSGLNPPGGSHIAELSVASAGTPIFLTITCRTGADDREFSLKASYRAGEEKRVYAIKREQLILPWAFVPPPPAPATLFVPDLSGGDPARGQTIFAGEQARCALCHTFRGKGGQVGPDLTEIGKKGRAELYRAIAAPSESIDPQYLAYTVATKDGQVIVGLVRALGADAIRVTDTNALSTIVPRTQIDQIRPSANSIMPVGLTGSLGVAAVRDVIAYLTSAASPGVARPTK
jgi:putative heme-binding domain-containing protein